SEFAVPDHALAAAERLGAERAAFGELIFENGSWRLEASAARVERPIPALPRTGRPLAPGTVDAGRTRGPPLAALVAQLDGVALKDTVPGVTSVRSAEALRDFGECYSLLVGQSFRTDSPGLLDAASLSRAERVCAQAEKSDPDFVSARAA